jgi:hypothetical protein
MGHDGHSTSNIPNVRRCYVYRFEFHLRWIGSLHHLAQQQLGSLWYVRELPIPDSYNSSSVDISSNHPKRKQGRRKLEHKRQTFLVPRNLSLLSSPTKGSVNTIPFEKHTHALHHTHTYLPLNKCNPNHFQTRHQLLLSTPLVGLVANYGGVVQWTKTKTTIHIINN